MESPNPQGIPNFKNPIPNPQETSIMEVLVPGMEEIRILGPQGTSSPIHRYQKPQTGILIPGNQRTSMP